ncbi:hypothetical protein CAPTEDRAFT_186160 [Capitella teleta]|uniref:LisH domain-containing protein n=1 Tax=Capitella teleta TaxID=283909 RepID=R7UBX3_CAPTE|nr:hypothetical protein CAPTEDRAFT_186160 [Capitella teleta]|eukprot:ELU03606.1 hypothetical protein CAPTEDRAFT_186160 [Capitella teleta]
MDTWYINKREPVKLVPGYLKSGGLMKSYKTFLQESCDLAEYSAQLKIGREYPLTYTGLTLIQILEEYGRLRMNAGCDNENALASSWHNFDQAVSQIKTLTSLPTIPASTQHTFHRQQTVRFKQLKYSPLKANPPKPQELSSDEDVMECASPAAHTSPVKAPALTTARCPPLQAAVNPQPSTSCSVDQVLPSKVTEINISSYSEVTKSSDPFPAPVQTVSSQQQHEQNLEAGTPVKSTAERIKEFASPRRKSHQPKRRTISPPLPPPTNESNSSDAQDTGIELVDELMKNTTFVERLAENINKVNRTDEMKPEENPVDLDAFLSQESLMPEDHVKSVIGMTSKDPAFDALFDLFKVDKDQFIEEQIGPPAPVETPSMEENCIEMPAQPQNDLPTRDAGRFSPGPVIPPPRSSQPVLASPLHPIVVLPPGFMHQLAISPGKIPIPRLPNKRPSPVKKTRVRKKKPESGKSKNKDSEMPKENSSEKESVDLDPNANVNKDGTDKTEGKRASRKSSHKKGQEDEQRSSRTRSGRARNNETETREETETAVECETRKETETIEGIERNEEADKETETQKKTTVKKIRTKKRKKIEELLVTVNNDEVSKEKYVPSEIILSPVKPKPLLSRCWTIRNDNGKHEMCDYRRSLRQNLTAPSVVQEPDPQAHVRTLNFTLEHPKSAPSKSNSADQFFPQIHFPRVVSSGSLSKDQPVIGCASKLLSSVRNSPKTKTAMTFPSLTQAVSSVKAPSPTSVRAQSSKRVPSILRASSSTSKVPTSVPSPRQPSSSSSSSTQPSPSSMHLSMPVDVDSLFNMLPSAPLATINLNDLQNDPIEEQKTTKRKPAKKKKVSRPAVSPDVVKETAEALLELAGSTSNEAVIPTEENKDLDSSLSSDGLVRWAYRNMDAGQLMCVSPSPEKAPPPAERETSSNRNSLEGDRKSVHFSDPVVSSPNREPSDETHCSLGLASLINAGAEILGKPLESNDRISPLKSPAKSSFLEQYILSGLGNGPVPKSILKSPCPKAKSPRASELMYSASSQDTSRGLKRPASSSDLNQPKKSRLDRRAKKDLLSKLDVAKFLNQKKKHRTSQVEER